MSEPLDILVGIKNTGNLRTLEWVFQELDRRGHRIRIFCKEIKNAESRRFLQTLVDECPHMRFVESPYMHEAGWSDLARSLRSGLDYLRYLEPRYAGADSLRDRAADVSPAWIRTAARIGGRPGRALLRRTLSGVERCFLPPASMERFLAEQKPDVLLVTPLVGFGTNQADLVRAARNRRIPVGFPVRSWDNLTNKGLLRDAPDLTILWNRVQEDEAVELHHVPRESIRVTGATAYDHWFDWQPSRTREEFCREVGLDPSKPFVTYVGSSQFIAPDEPDFVREWVPALRAHGGALADCGLLIRQHPLNTAAWRDLEFDDPQVQVWPKGGQFPLGEAARQNYFDSIYHSAAVMGINTSAQIEAAIVGRPVHTVIGRYRSTQEGTLHFHYLVDPEFGHVHAATTLDEHAAQLERSIREGDAEGRNERFLLRFVRPHGLDVRATPLAADAVEEAARVAPAPAHVPVFAPLVRLGLRPLVRRSQQQRAKAREADRGEAPLVEIRRATRAVARTTGPVVAGPWEGDELGELVYWIPYLRWATLVTFELPERLTVVARDETRGWYAGLAANVVGPNDPLPDAEARLQTALIDRNRELLAEGDPWSTFGKRRLDFKPFPASAEPEPYTGPYGVSAWVAFLSGQAVTLTDEPPAHELELARKLSRPPFGTMTVAGREPVLATA